MYIEIHNIHWDAEANTTDLPERAVFETHSTAPASIAEEATEFLANKYGYTVEMFQMCHHHTLDDARRSLATALFESYDFHAYLAASGGWEFTTGDHEWTRPVYLEPHDDPAAPAEKAYFTVRFASAESVDVTDAYCMLDGEFIGAAR